MKTLFISWIFMRSTQIIIVMVTDFLFRLIARVGVFRLCQVYIWVAASVQEASRSSDLEIQAVAPLSQHPRFCCPVCSSPSTCTIVEKPSTWLLTWILSVLPVSAKIFVNKWIKSENKGKIIHFLLDHKHPSKLVIKSHIWK